MGSRRTGEVVPPDWRDPFRRVPEPPHYRNPALDLRAVAEFEVDCWVCNGTGYFGGRDSGPCRICYATGLVTYRGYPKGATMDTRTAGALGGRKVREERGAEFFREIGRAGGERTLAKHGPEHFRAMADRRWAEHRALKADLPATLAEQAEDPDGDG